MVMVFRPPFSDVNEPDETGQGGLMVMVFFLLMDGPDGMKGQGALIVMGFLPFLLLIHFDQLRYFAPTFKKNQLH